MNEWFSALNLWSHSNIITTFTSQPRHHALDKSDQNRGHMTLVTCSNSDFISKRSLRIYLGLSPQVIIQYIKWKNNKEDIERMSLIPLLSLFFPFYLLLLSSFLSLPHQSLSYQFWSNVHIECSSLICALGIPTEEYLSHGWSMHLIKSNKNR